jgi:hypothetical protein
MFSHTTLLTLGIGSSMIDCTRRFVASCLSASRSIFIVLSMSSARSRFEARRPLSAIMANYFDTALTSRQRCPIRQIKGWIFFVCPGCFLHPSARRLADRRQLNRWRMSTLHRARPTFTQYRRDGLPVLQPGRGQALDWNSDSSDTRVASRKVPLLSLLHLPRDEAIRDIRGEKE